MKAEPKGKGRTKSTKDDYFNISRNKIANWEKQIEALETLNRQIVMDPAVFSTDMPSKRTQNRQETIDIIDRCVANGDEKISAKDRNLGANKANKTERDVMLGKLRHRIQE